VLSYEEAIGVLYSHIYKGLSTDERARLDAGRPDRARALLRELGEPQLRYPTIHVTGTKGKGSTAIMIAAMLQAAGLRIGVMTSPHLQDIRERMQIDRAMISKDEFAARVTALIPLFDAHADSGFPEVMNALTFHYFADEKVDAAVIEVGVGGRLDATNVLQPEAVVFTSISYDHMHLLGNTLAEIATEKAALIKPGSAAISAPQADEVVAVLDSVARSQAVPLQVIGRDIRFREGAASRDGQAFTVADEEYRTALIGTHQAANGATAVGAVEVLRARGFNVPREAMRVGLASAFWPGRLEVLPGDPLILLDGAHNGESALRLCEALKALFPERPRVVVFAAKENKDVAATLRGILPAADVLILTRSADQITQPPEVLAPYVLQAGFTGFMVVQPDLSVALRNARTLAAPRGLICVTGSLYLIGEARTLLALEPNRPAPPGYSFPL